MKSAVVATVIFCMAFQVMGADSKRRFDISDLAKLETINEPSFAPDTNRIVYVLSQANIDSDRTVSDLWLTTYDTQQVRQLTHTPYDSEWSPRWSPDGKWLAFLSDRGELEWSQLWLMPADGGEARQLSQFAGSVEAFDWSPDSRRIVFVAEEVPPKPQKDARGEDKPVPPLVITRFQFKEDGRDYLTNSYKHLHVLELADGRVTPLTTGAHDDVLPAWSPDGRSIAFVSKRGADPDRHLNYDVFVVPAIGGEPKPVSPFTGTDVDPYWESRPEWSPDSQKLAWLQSSEDKWIYYSPWQIVVADLASGTLSSPARIDRCFYKPRWSADGQSLYALIEQSRNTWLAKIDIKKTNSQQAITYLTHGKRFASDYTISANGSVAVLDGDDVSPAALRALTGRNGRALTPHNAFLAEVQLQHSDEIDFQVDGVRVDGFLMKPIGYQAGRRYPTLLRIHGGPVYQFSHEFMADWQLYAAHGYAVLAVNPRGSSGRGFEFAKAIYAAWGSVDVEDVLAGVEHAVALGVADSARLGIGGWSYGSILTNYVIARDQRFKAAVSGAGTSNLLGNYGHDQYSREYELELGTPWRNTETYLRVSYPFLHADRIQTPTLFQCAEKDFNVPCLGAEQMYQALRSQNKPAMLVIYPGENHRLTIPSYVQDRARQNLAWYDRFVKNDPTP